MVDLKDLASKSTSTSSLPFDEKRPQPTVPDVEASKEAPEEWKAHKREYLVMASLAVISLVVALDATILVLVLPTLAKDLNGTAIDAFWAGISYLLTCAVFQPFTAALSDIFGRQELLLPSLVLFTVGSIVCGVARDVTTLLAGRCIQGVGGGGVITLTQIIFADIIPLRQRPKFFSLVLAAWALGSVLGPFVGGVFAQKATWRWVFWVNLPFCGAGLIMIPLFVKLKTERTSLKSKLLRVDWIGGFIFVGSLTSFLIGVSWGGVQFAWSSFRTLVPIIIGAFGVVVSLIWERYGANEPFLRRSLFCEGSAIAAYLCALIQGLILFCCLYYFPLYLLAVRSYSPIGSGTAIFAVTCLLLPGSAVVSILITRLGHFRWAIWIGWAVATTGTGLFILLHVHLTKAAWIAACMVFGLGNGMVLSSLNFGIQAVVRAEDAGRAASMYAFLRTLGMALGVATGGTVFQNLMSAKLAALGLSTEIARDAESFVAVLKTLAVSQRVGAIEAYVHGIRGVFVFLTAVSGAALLASLSIKRHSMDKILESKYTLDREA